MESNVLSDCPFPCGKEIREVREEECLSQRGLARLSGLSSSYFTKIELGKVRPSEEALNKIGNALDIRTKDIFHKWIKYLKDTAPFQQAYPELYSFLNLINKVMNEDQKALSFSLYEEFLIKYHEDKNILATDIASYIVAASSPDARPIYNKKNLYRLFTSLGSK